MDLIEPLLEESTHHAGARLVVPNRDGRLRPGQFGEVEFELPRLARALPPRDAVIRTGEHEYVYVATSADRFEPRVVRTGLARGRVQVLSGVAEGDRVVTRGSFMFDSESRLQGVSGRSPGASLGFTGRSPPTRVLRARRSSTKSQPDKYRQCRACERQHAGMGSMVADCKNAIPRPWEVMP